MTARRANTEEAAAAAGHGLAEIGTEGKVFADEAVGAAPVAGGDDRAGGVDDVDRQRARPLVELFEIGIDLRRQLAVIRLAEQRQHIAFEAKRAGQEGVFADLTFQAGGVQVEPVQAGGLQLGDAQLLREAVRSEAAQPHQGEEQQ